MCRQQQAKRPKLKLLIWRDSVAKKKKNTVHLADRVVLDEHPLETADAVPRLPVQDGMICIVCQEAVVVVHLRKAGRVLHYLHGGTKRRVSRHGRLLRIKHMVRGTQLAYRTDRTFARPQAGRATRPIIRA